MFPIPSPAQLVKIYSYEQNNHKLTKLIDTLNPGLGLVLKNTWAHRILDFWSRAVTTDRVQKTIGFQSSGTIIDIGCGPGFYLAEMKAKGFEIWGSEIGDKLVGIANKNTQTKNVQKGTIEEIKFPTADIISFWHVLEHIANFDQTIAKACSLLRKNGVLIIEVPHGNALNSKIFKGKWTLLLLPQHLFFWTSKSLELFLTRHKLRIEKIEFPNHFPFVFLSSLVKVSSLSIYLAPIVLPLSLAVAVISNSFGLGDVIRVYARNNN